MKTFNKSEIFTKAWELLKKGVFNTISEALQNAWKYAKGFLKFADLVVGDQLLLNNMMQADKCVVDSVTSESVMVRWNDDTTDEVSLNEDVTVVADDEFTTCGFQIIK